MRTIIAHWAQGSGHGTQQNAACLEAWSKDHDGYYGLPCGSQKIIIEIEGIKFERYCGLQDRLDTAEIWTHVLNSNRDVPIMKMRDILRAVEDPEAPIGGWITSAGNVTLVLDYYEYRQGRRHGVRKSQETDPRDGWTYIETRAEGHNPDEKGIEA